MTTTKSRANIVVGHIMTNNNINIDDILFKHLVIVAKISANLRNNVRFLIVVLCFFVNTLINIGEFGYKFALFDEILVPL